jgi:hypothetical protein
LACSQAAGCGIRVRWMLAGRENDQEKGGKRKEEKGRQILKKRARGAGSVDTADDRAETSQDGEILWTFISKLPT